MDKLTREAVGLLGDPRVESPPTAARAAANAALCIVVAWRAHTS